MWNRILSLTYKLLLSISEVVKNNLALLLRIPFSILVEQSKCTVTKNEQLKVNIMCNKINSIAAEERSWRSSFIEGYFYVIKNLIYQKKS